MAEWKNKLFYGLVAYGKLLYKYNMNHGLTLLPFNFSEKPRNTEPAAQDNGS